MPVKAKPAPLPSEVQDLLFEARRLVSVLQGKCNGAMQQLNFHGARLTAPALLRVATITGVLLRQLDSLTGAMRPDGKGRKKR
jgi:hypothetical protein